MVAGLVNAYKTCVHGLFEIIYPRRRLKVETRKEAPLALFFCGWAMYGKHMNEENIEIEACLVHIRELVNASLPDDKNMRDRIMHIIRVYGILKSIGNDKNRALLYSKNDVKYVRDYCRAVLRDD